MSLKKKITVYICSFTVIMLIILSSVIYFRSEKMLNSEAETLMMAQLDRAQENIYFLTEINKIEAEELSKDFLVQEFYNKEVSQETVEAYLDKKMKAMNTNYPFYKDLFLLNKDGIIIATLVESARRIDLSTRPYFKRAKISDNTAISDILIARSDGDNIVNTLTPVFNSKGQVQGYAGIAVKAKYFSTFIENFSLGETGYYIVVDSNNLILSHPDTNKIFKKFKYSHLIGSKEYKGHHIEIDGERVFMIGKTMERKNWKIVAILKDKEIYEKSIQLSGYIIMFGILLILTAIFLGKYLSDKISMPIVAMTNSMNTLVDGTSSFKSNLQNTIDDLREETIPHNYTKEPSEIGNLRNSLLTLKGHFLKGIYKFEKESKILQKRANNLINEIDETQSQTLDFISKLSHDIRTPLTLIKGYSRGLEDHVELPKEVRKQFLNGIIDNVSNIETIVHDVLDTSYEVYNTPSLRRKRVTIRDFIDNIELETKILLDNRSRNLIFIKDSFIESKDTIFIDDSKMKRVWSNLISNAIKYTNEGGTIVQSFKRINNHMTWIIEDDGTGIKKEHMKKIFNMFYRANTIDKKGYGLGLYITKSILDAHGFTIKVESEYNKGTKIIVNIPID
ncbi:sensor histidine kinase [Anaeromicrobium sediminis]|uniref:histidine kinase n=1 Tax=Anaeromicrobium sediminis TaxID=1478221 RepID=A0A267MLN2_9FIRM|nr:sensor histidine kinase [Anaeromicrobium sediminis]PAB59818.1 hypothetical protein CCE28_07635 [Anaeromicrobium sediminis]